MLAVVIVLICLVCSGTGNAQNIARIEKKVEKYMHSNNDDDAKSVLNKNIDKLFVKNSKLDDSKHDKKLENRIKIKQLYCILFSVYKNTVNFAIGDKEFMLAIDEMDELKKNFQFKYKENPFYLLFFPELEFRYDSMRTMLYVNYGDSELQMGNLRGQNSSALDHYNSAINCLGIVFDILDKDNLQLLGMQTEMKNMIHYKILLLHYKLGTEFQKEGRFIDAVKAFDEGASNQLDFINDSISIKYDGEFNTNEHITKNVIFKRIAECHYANSDYLLAGEYFEKANMIQKAIDLYILVEEYYKAAFLYEIGLHDLEKAADFYKKAEEWETAGELFLKCKQLENAIECYKETENWGHIAQLYEENNETVKASDYYKLNEDYLKSGELLIDANRPPSKETWLDYAKIYSEKSQNSWGDTYDLLEKAAKCYEFALSYLKAADIYFSVESYSNAAINYEKSIKNGNKSFDVHLSAGKAFNEIGEYSKANNYFDNASEIALKYEDFSNFLIAFQAAGKNDEGIQKINKIAIDFENDNEIGDAYETYRQLYLHLSYFDDRSIKIGEKIEQLAEEFEKYPQITIVGTNRYGEDESLLSKYSYTDIEGYIINTNLDEPIRSIRLKIKLFGVSSSMYYFSSNTNDGQEKDVSFLYSEEPGYIEYFTYQNILPGDSIRFNSKLSCTVPYKKFSHNFCQLEIGN